MRTTEGPTACTAAVTNDVFRRAPPTGVGGSRPGSLRRKGGYRREECRQSTCGVCARMRACVCACVCVCVRV